TVEGRYRKTISVLCINRTNHSLYEFIFFFQAEDGIRDFHVTGVQTCALPISICEPSGSLRTISKMVCAATVVAPRCTVVAGTVSMICRSRSVAIRRRPSSSASISTFDRMGMVLRRSTTDWTWARAFRTAARSTVTLIDPSFCAAELHGPVLILPQHIGGKPNRHPIYGFCPR